MSIDTDNNMFDALATGITVGLNNLGYGIAWAGFWIGLGIAVYGLAH